mgnify:CR=1 FL=1|jgi:hypothetical protein
MTDAQPLDPIALHMQVINGLARCKACLTANEPMYLFAKQQLDGAREALAALAALDGTEPGAAH